VCELKRFCSVHFFSVINEVICSGVLNWLFFSSCEKSQRTVLLLNNNTHIAAAGRGQVKNITPITLHNLTNRPFRKELERSRLTFSLLSFPGHSSTMCSVFCQSTKVYRGVQGVQQRQRVSKDAHGTAAACSAAPEKCPNEAHEEPGLW